MSKAPEVSAKVTLTRACGHVETSYFAGTENSCRRTARASLRDDCKACMEVRAGGWSASFKTAMAESVLRIEARRAANPESSLTWDWTA